MPSVSKWSTRTPRAQPLQLLLRVAEAIVPLLPPDTEALGGLELGGVSIATMVSSLTGLLALFARKEAKRYGTRKLAEGADVRHLTVTLIEDVITTGGAVHDATMALRQLGAEVHTVVCAIDRSEPGQNILDSVDVTTRSVLDKRTLDSVRGSDPRRDPSSSPR